MNTGKSGFWLIATGGANDGDYISIDDESLELMLSESRTLFFAEIHDAAGENLLMRLRTKDNLYVRHANYILRVDKRTENDRPWEEDSLWWVKFHGKSLKSDENIVEHRVNRGDRFRRPLFIHMRVPWKSMEDSRAVARLLEDYIESHLTNSSENTRIGNVPGLVKSYPLQGAGGMESARAMAVSMLRPGQPVSESLKNRIEEASTVKSRGGMASFVNPPSEVSRTIQNLSSAALREMKRMRMFGLISRRAFDLELGFCEWVILPPGSEIVPHRDGGNDCDVAAIFCVRNRSDCTVEGTTITLDTAEMYVFEPQKYTHSVGKPQLPGSRLIIALRFFRCEL